MTKVELKILDFIKKYLPLFLVIGATAAGMLMRLQGMEFQSDDFNSFLNPWWGVIQQNGVEGLANQVGNYNIPYQILTFLLTLLPFEALTAYKLVSVFFDLVLAVSSFLLVYEVRGKKSLMLPAIAYSLVFCSLTVVFNSSFWAQCDSIYVSFILLALYFTLKDKRILCFIMLGVALAFKLQMVFILPFFVYYYVSTKRFSILHFLIIPAVDIVMCLPAVFLGRSFLDIFTIYAEQTDYGKLIVMNYPNVYAVFCEVNNPMAYYQLKGLSVILTFTILGIGLGMIIWKKVDLTRRRELLLTAIWTVFTCLMFLSSMHERYGYLLDILLILFVVVYRKHYMLAIAVNLASLWGYCNYLFGSAAVPEPKLVAAINLGFYAYACWVFVKEVILGESGGGKLRTVV